MAVEASSYNPQCSVSNAYNNTQEELIFDDHLISNIDSDLRAKLLTFPSSSFVGSFGYCESYLFPPVQRVACLSECSGTLRQVLFYNRCRLAGFLRVIEIIGTIDP